MKKRKGSLLQRMMAVLLSAVLVTGMVSNGAPMTVLAQEQQEAQESVGGNPVETVEGGTEMEDETETEPAVETNPEGQEPGGGMEQETPGTGTEEETEPGTVSGNDAAPEAAAEPQSVMMAAAPAPQADNIASGDGWVLDADGKLTISSDTGMTGWKTNRNTYKGQVTSAEIQDGVTSIGESAFASCSSLTSITIPESVTDIGDYAFRFSGLTSITIPERVTSIGTSVFQGCGSLTDITIKGDTPPTLGYVVFGLDNSSDGHGPDDRCGFVKNGTQGIHVPDGKAQAYKDAWADWAAYIADDTPTPPAEEHKHNDVTFTAWTATDSLPTAAGNYYLTDNVTLSATWNVPGETNLCLNGKTISASGTDEYRVITIPKSGTLNLYDCQNAGNITGGKGGGVWNDGTFCMYGGKISGNGKVYGVGGVLNNGTFDMYGGEISGNSAESGNGGVETYGKFSMYGGKIINNECNGEWLSGGGGVNINGGGSFTVGGGAVICGNTCNGKEDNVYLSNSRRLITIAGSNPLSDSANIGVTTETAPTDASPVSITGANSADYSRYFHSDNADYEIVNGENNVLQLAVKASPDTQPPTGKIEIATSDFTSASWTEFLAPDKVAFHLFFKDRKWVTIESADDGGSGVYGTHYYVSNDALTKAQVEALGADAWTADAAVILEPEPDRKCIVYAKITDGAGNVAYLSSDGLVFDTTPPVINGVTDGETCNAPQTVTVTDAMSGVKSVTVNGTEVTLTDNQFTLGTADNPQAIVVTDKAGNTAAVTVTVKAQTQSYAVTVHNGTGTGIYRAGDTVTITADAPANGKQFDRWEVNSGGVTLADATSSATTFTMPERDVEVEATYKDITEEHTHRYGDWQHDSTRHWKVCSCGDVTGRGNHDFGDWVTDKAATATEAGTKHRVCQTCGYRQTETIPATGTEPGGGTVTPEVKPGANAPVTNISTPTAELEDMLLTDEEKQQVKNGTDVRIILEVQDAGSTVSAEDKENIQQALNGFTVGQYLNIDLYKLVGANRTDITETAKKIRIVITVPDSLKNTGSNRTRTFAVIRVHDGRAELLTVLDNSADAITIETDRFSTYAIVYKDTANSGGDNSGDSGDNKGDNGSNGSNHDKRMNVSIP